jgi:hypothetical protein
MNGLRKGLFGCFLLVLCILFLTGVAGAADFCVSSAAELQAALTEASGNGQDDVIRIVQGTYEGNFVYDSTESNSLTIEGGYRKKCGRRQGDPATSVLDAKNSGRVLEISCPGAPADFVVDGLTIRNGNVTAGIGGGLLICTNRGSTTVTNNTVSDNSAPSAGGIYICEAEEITLTTNNIGYNVSTESSAPGGLFPVYPYPWLLASHRCSLKQ